jgi:two-component system cell cycle sensor histidine kinase/response regulator CckA
MSQKPSYEQLQKQVAKLEEEIEEYKQAELSRKKLRDIWALTFDAIDDIVTIQDESQCIVRANRAAYQLFGAKNGTFTGRYCYEVFSGRSGPCPSCPLQITLGSGLNSSAIIEHKQLNKVFHVSATLIPPDGGGEKYLIHVARDITDQVMAERILRESQQRFALAFDASPDSVNINRLEDGLYVEINKGFTDLTGFAWEDVRGRTSLEIDIWHDPADRQRLVKSLKENGFCDNLEAKFRRKNGIYATALMSARIIFLNGIPHILSITRDISERIRLQAQLQQAQKMESIGRLTGGVAHDFNNILGVIIGYAEMALSEVDPRQRLHDELGKILDAAKRSADIIRQLLAFSRQQAISPQVLDLNGAVQEMLKILKRLIGEDIELSWLPQTPLQPIKMDPAQLNQILVNLCINGRDAIQGTGNITLETSMVAADEKCCSEPGECQPGQFVELAVSDNGCGIARELQEKIFEPFFTTKMLGEGTGLGLSTVYGIVKQNNGFINVYSEPDKGTTFKVYFPCCSDKVVKMPRVAALETNGVKQRTILLVEDDPILLTMTHKMLEHLGYRVLPANSPEEAVKLAEEHAGNIHLLFTDVVMPKMNGKELATLLQSRYPQLKCLFTSGYTANVIADRGILEEDIHFIQKPYSISTLATKLLESIDGLDTAVTITPDARR